MIKRQQQLLVDERSLIECDPLDLRLFCNGFEESSNDYFYTRDHLGSIREVVASDGLTIQSIYDYSPWGEIRKLGGTGVESDFLYTGHFYLSPSDLHLTLYRAYNPELGMWLSRDPIAENGGLNLYAYVGNNPIMRYDPLGLYPGQFIVDYWSDAIVNPSNGTVGGSIISGIEGTGQGFMGFVDGVVPFVDPLEAAGGYDSSCDKSLQASQFIGGATRDVASFLGGGALGLSTSRRNLYNFWATCFVQRVWAWLCWLGHGQGYYTAINRFRLCR
jgi:RHS repeat-associated protein